MANATHDTRYKALFGHPDMVRELIIGFVHDDYLQHLDFDTLEKVSESYVSDTFQVREEDAVWRVKAGESYTYVYLMLEFQSTVDAFMALRVMVYVGLLYQELIKRGEVGPSALLPPVLPIVLYNGESRWHAAEDMMELIAAAPGMLSGFRPSMRYLLIDEGRYSDSELASQRNVVAAIFRLE